MKLIFDTKEVLGLHEEFEDGKLWLNISKDDKLGKEDTELLFTSGEVKYRADGLLDHTELDQECISALYYLLKRDKKIYLINNVVGSVLNAKPFDFNIQELEKAIGSTKDFSQPILADFFDSVMIFSDDNSKLEFEITKDGIETKLKLAKWKNKNIT
jgi:hypothetical protein